MTSSWKQRVADSFAANLQDYERHNTIQEKAADRLVSLLPDLTTPVILEIGCGTGAFTRRLLPVYEGASLYVSDISPQILSHTKRSLQNADVRAAYFAMDGEKPACAGPFDLIVCNMGFQWFEAPEDSLNALRALLKPGGQILYSVPGPDCFREWRETLAKLHLPVGLLNFEQFTAIPIGIFEDAYHEVHYESGLDFLRTLKRTGATVPRRGYRPQPPRALRAACHAFDERFEGKITWQICYGRIEKAVEP